MKRIKQVAWFLRSAFKCAVGRAAKVGPDEELIQALTLQYLHSGAAGNTWRTVVWRGHQILKAPTDLWMYCEIIDRLKPRTIVETGTWEGGSAIFLRDMCRVRDLPTQVVTIDISPRKTPPCEGVEYIVSSSTNSAVLERVGKLEHPMMIILDSDHSYEHVKAELKVYTKMMLPGEFVIVEDTVDVDAGPRLAVEEFLTNGARFEVCRQYERLGLTFNRGGYLRKL